MRNRVPLAFVSVWLIPVVALVAIVAVAIAVVIAIKITKAH